MQPPSPAGPQLLCADPEEDFISATALLLITAKLIIIDCPGEAKFYSHRLFFIKVCHMNGSHTSLFEVLLSLKARPACVVCSGGLLICNEGIQCLQS